MCRVSICYGDFMCRASILFCHACGLACQIISRKTKFKKSFIQSLLFNCYLKVLSVLFRYIQYFPFLSFPFIENTQTYWRLNDTLARCCLYSLRSTQSEVWYNHRTMRVCVVQHNRSITKGLENMHGTTAGNFS